MAKQSQSQASNGEIQALTRANERLKSENAQLKTELEGHHGFLTRGWRGLAITLCVLLATLALVAGNILFWAGDTLVNNDRYVKTVTPVLQDSAVQTAVANYATVQIFKNVDVNQEIQQALPPRAAFLAGPLTSAVKGATEKTLNKAVSGDKFQAIWVQANSQGHQRLISSIKHSNGDGVLNIQEVYDRLSKSLQNSKLSFLSGKDLPSKVGSIEVVHAEWVPKVRTIINNISWIKPVSLLLVALFSALGIWLSRNRRKLVIILASSFSISMLVSLIIFRVVRSNIVDHFQPAYQTAADHAAHIIMAGLVEQTATILCASLAIVLVAWLTGPYRAAATGRERIRLLFSGQLHQAIFGGHETGLTRWLGGRKKFLQWLTVGVISALMLFIRLTPGLIVLYLLLALLIVLIIETIAAPANPHKR